MRSGEAGEAGDAGDAVFRREPNDMRYCYSGAQGRVDGDTRDQHPDTDRSGSSFGKCGAQSAARGWRGGGLDVLAEAATDEEETEAERHVDTAVVVGDVRPGV